VRLRRVEVDDGCSDLRCQRIRHSLRLPRRRQCPRSHETSCLRCHEIVCPRCVETGHPALLLPDRSTRATEYRFPTRSLETREIRTDGFGEGSLCDSSDGQAPRDDEIWVLRMEEASADRTIEESQSATEP